MGHFLETLPLYLCFPILRAPTKHKTVFIPQVPSDLAFARDGGETPATPKQPHHTLPSLALPLGA
jgi:hypothetical protein